MPQRSSCNKRGAQPGHVLHPWELVPAAELDPVRRHVPDTRCRCGGAFVIDTAPKERRPVFDLPAITHTVIKHPCVGGTCPGWRRESGRPAAAGGRHRPNGPGLIIWIALMSGHFRLTTLSIQASLEMQWGLTFSTGAISQAQESVADWLAPLPEHIGETIHQAPLAAADETTPSRAPIGTGASDGHQCPGHLL